MNRVLFSLKYGLKLYFTAYIFQRAPDQSLCLFAQMECLVVDVTMVTCACLQMIVASTAVARMRKVMRAREDESLVIWHMTPLYTQPYVFA